MVPLKLNALRTPLSRLRIDSNLRGCGDPTRDESDLGAIWGLRGIENMHDSYILSNPAARRRRGAVADSASPPGGAAFSL